MSVCLESGLHNCFGCGAKGNARQFAERLGVPPPDNGQQEERKVTTFDYRDEAGNVLFQVVRFPGKRFKQHRPDGKGGWIWGLKGVRRLLYRLNELQGRNGVFLVEGEKDADRLWTLGLPATTNPMGAGKWRDEYAEQLLAAGVKKVAILPDNDGEGRKHANQVALSCLKAGLQAKLIHLPDLPHKGDVSDWLDKGHTKDELFEIVKATPETTLKDLAQEAGQEGENPLVRLIPASEFEAPPIEWLVDGLIPAGMLTLFSGKDTLGKTLFGLEIGRSVLMGQPLLGHWTVGQTGPVVALFLDDPRPVTYQRLEALGIKGRPDLWVASYDDVDLADPLAMLEKLESEALRIKARLIILDSLWHFVPSRLGAANDQGLMRPLMQTLVRLAGRTGAAVLLVAHDRKDGTDVAGSHILRAAAKTIMRLMLPRGVETDPDEMPDTPDRVLTLQGNLVQPKTWRVRVEGVGAWTFCGTQREHRSNELLEIVRVFLLEDGEGTFKEIAEALKKRPSDVKDALSQLVQTGEAETYQPEAEGKGRPKTIYRASNLVPENILVPNPPELKSEPLPFDIQRDIETDDFSSQVPVPRGEIRDGNSLPRFTGDHPEPSERPSLDFRTWPKG